MGMEYSRRRLSRKVYSPDDTEKVYKTEVVNPGRIVARSVAAAIEAAKAARYDKATGSVCVSLSDLLNDNGEDIAYIKYPAYAAAASAAAASVFSAVDEEQTARYADLCEQAAAAMNLTPTEAAIFDRRTRGQSWGHIVKAMGYKTAGAVNRHRASIEAKALAAGYGSLSVAAAIRGQDEAAALAIEAANDATTAEAIKEQAAAKAAADFAAIVERHGVLAVEYARLVDRAHADPTPEAWEAAAKVGALEAKALAMLLSAAIRATKAEAARTAARTAAQAAAVVATKTARKAAASTAAAVVAVDDTGRIVAEFASIGEAAKATGASKGAISLAIKGARQTAAGFRWVKA
jgi:hypothetical protein